MKVRSEARRSLTDFKLRSFDCFGTLVDYDCECSLHPCFGIPDPVIMTSWHLQYLLSRLLSTHPLNQDRALAVKTFDDIEGDFLQAVWTKT